MKVCIRKWNGVGKGFGPEEIVHVGAYEGLSFRRVSEGTALPTTNYPGWRVTEMYMRASEEALVVYLEQEERR